MFMNSISIWLTEWQNSSVAPPTYIILTSDDGNDILTNDAGDEALIV